MSFLFIFCLFSILYRERAQEKMRLGAYPLCCLQRICCFYWESRPILEFSALSHLLVTVQPGNHWQFKPLMRRSGTRKRSALLGPLGRIMDGSPAFSHNLFTQKCWAALSGHSLQMLSTEWRWKLVSAVPLFLGIWPSLRDVPFEFNYIDLCPTVQIVQSQFILSL